MQMQGLEDLYMPVNHEHHWIVFHLKQSARQITSYDSKEDNISGMRLLFKVNCAWTAFCTVPMMALCRLRNSLRQVYLHLAHVGELKIGPRPTW